MPITTTLVPTAGISVGQLDALAAELRAEGAGCVVAVAPDALEVTLAAADPEVLADLRRSVSARPALRGAEWSAPYGGDEVETTHPVAAQYVLDHCTPADRVLRELAAETRALPGGAARMQVSHDEGAFLTLLTRLTGARSAVEVGVFTGYSSLCIARGLAEGGRLLACDVNEEWGGIARRHWERAGVADRIDLVIAPALETLRALPAAPEVDLAFVDADKAGYPAYYEELVPRLRPGGLIVLDNVFLGGRVLDPAFDGPDHRAVRELNAFVAADPRVEAVMLPLRDGVTVARKR
ncbi:O-methyltransferase [Kitasatospora sp. NPDC096147]|uniref:O-methyltransferase n=1 Tax=Kitasatospora sp. NPDC096147 TaxID=3364093 RepID=UPI003828121C